MHPILTPFITREMHKVTAKWQSTLFTCNRADTYFGGHSSKSFGSHVTHENVDSQIWVVRVTQIHDSGANTLFVFGVGGFEEIEYSIFNLNGEIFCFKGTGGWR